jgi:DNA-binding response OmpR family regulator
LQEGHHGAAEILRSPRLTLRVAFGGERVGQREPIGFAGQASDQAMGNGRAARQPLRQRRRLRRERRILEYLAANRGRRVTKTQVFNAIYGIFDEEVEENVVESHISKLRKKLREKLGFDPIDSKRFLGYRLVG